MDETYLPHVTCEFLSQRLVQLVLEPDELEVVCGEVTEHLVLEFLPNHFMRASWRNIRASLRRICHHKNLGLLWLRGCNTALRIQWSVA